MDDSEITLLDKRFKENIIFTIIKSIKSNFNPPKTPPNKLFRSPKQTTFANFVNPFATYMISTQLKIKIKIKQIVFIKSMFALVKEDTLSDNTLSTLPAIKKAINIPKKLDNSIINPFEYPLIIPYPIIAIIIKSIEFIKLNLYLQYTEG